MLLMKEPLPLHLIPDCHGLQATGGKIGWHQTWPRRWNGVTKKKIVVELGHSVVHYLAEHVPMFQV